MTDLPFLLLKPLFNMLWIYSCNPASCTALHVRYIYVVLALVWGRANSSAKLSSSSSGHVQGTHSFSTLGSCSPTSYLSPLSQFLSPPGKAIFLSSSLFPTNMQAKTIPATCTPLELTDSSPGTGADCDQTLGMLCSVLFRHGRRKSI